MRKLMQQLMMRDVYSLRLSSKYRQAVGGLGFVMLIGAIQPCAAEQIFEKPVRIQLNGAPTLLLEQTNDYERQVWALTNHTGGFHIADRTRNQSPFFISNGAPHWSLVVGHDGKVGLGTPAPAADLHLAPLHGEAAIRLQTVDPGHYVDSIWDLKSDGYAFTLSDVYGGQVPFTVESDTPSDTLYLSNFGRGHVGIGTSHPHFIGNGAIGDDARHLNLDAGMGTARSITQGQVAAESYLVQNGGAAGAKVVRTRVSGGRYVISTMKDDLSKAVEPDAFSIALATGNVGIKTATSKYPLQVGDRGQKDGNGAYVSTGGVWTNACSRAVKDHIEPITLEQARDTVRALQPVGYHYKNEPGEHYCGFIAEDAPDLVATKDRQSLACMDIVSVLTRVVQDQDRQLEEAAKRDERQRQMIDRQQEMLASMHERLLKLEENGASQSSRRAEVIVRNSRP